MNKPSIWVWAVIIYCVGIFVTTASPASTGGETQQLIQNLFSLSADQAALVNVGIRKSVHFIAYGVLAVLIFQAIGKKSLFVAWLLTTVYAASDEIHQAFVPARTGSILDVLLDSFGALIALSILFIHAKKRRATASSPT